jgi:ribosomal protein L11 methyltransferase
MAEYTELQVEINPVWAEYVADILIKKIGCQGVVTEETSYKDEEITKSTKDLIKGYLWHKPQNPLNIEEIKTILYTSRQELIDTEIPAENLGSWNINFKEVEDEEWAHSWKKYWHPMKIGNKIVICPSWEQYEIQNEEIKIELDPGSAFGTGTHPTTRLCIVALEKYLKQNDSVADVGTGSGILAVAAAKLGAKSITGVDNDPSVIEVAIDNAAKNNCIDICNFYEGSAADVKNQYDVVVANILAEIIVSIMDDLVKLTKKGGKFIFSGIITQKSDMVKEKAISSGLKIIETIIEEEWVAIIAEK